MAHTIEHLADPNKAQPGYLVGNDYALPYSSQFSRTVPSHAELLSCMNCGYLSTEGVAPTLLALKQHAQSLAYLISLLDPTVPDGEEKTDFDWLASLSERYENDDANHHKPLHSLLNDTRGRHDVHGTTYHCPMTQFPARRVGEPLYPYANHHNLIMHANACLERLDHEFSATGGLLSMLPPDMAAADADLARNAILGQWLLYTQRLVGRMHELELAYGNALDALDDRALAPLQHMSAAGPDGRSGREVAYPQDRFVLVNAGDDVVDLLHNMLDREEAVHRERERAARAQGLSGERMFVAQSGPAGDAAARGIVAVDVQSRFYRLAGHAGRDSTLFVIPAWERHPHVAHTARLERGGGGGDGLPTVVSSVQPKFPPRATELEKRYEERLALVSRLEQENATLREGVDVRDRELVTLRAHLARETVANKALEARFGRKEDVAEKTLGSTE